MKRRKNPAGYKVICISFYKDELREMDRKVAALKAAGITTMSRSRLLRHAVRDFNPRAWTMEAGR